MKVIVQVWTQSCVNAPQTETDNFWGIGDFIRGTIQLYLLSKELGFEFYVDTTLHPMSKFLLTTNNPYRQIVHANKDNINLLPAHVDLKNIIAGFQDGLYMFFTNAHCDRPITQECKEFIKSILKPIPSLENELNTIPLKSYEIMHLRLGDQELIKDISRNISPDIIKLIQDNKSSNTLLISDSASIKKCPEAIDGLYVTNSIPKHTGRCKDSDSIKDTLVDFLLVSRSTNIKTYSCYSWVSGFIYWAHIIYNIPIIELNTFHKSS